MMCDSHPSKIMMALSPLPTPPPGMAASLHDRVNRLANAAITSTSTCFGAKWSYG
jgi:hypothetical protein